MSTASVSNTFTNGTTAVASEVNTNFSDLVSYINTNCIVKDGTLASTAVLTGPSTDPSSDNHYSRKAYVDGLVGRDTASSALGTYTTIAFDTMENAQTHTITNPNKAVVVVAHGSVIGTQGNATTSLWARIAISFDNGATYTTGPQLKQAVGSGNSCGFTPWHRVAGTPTGNIIIKLQVQQTSAVVTKATWAEAAITRDMFKTVTV